MTKSQSTQDHQIFKVSTPLGKDKLLFRQIKGMERLSDLFRYEVEMLSTDNALSFTALTGKPLTVILDFSGSYQRHINGIVEHFSQGASDPDKDGVEMTVYHAVIRPWFWQLTLNRNCRIFQNLSVPEIIKKIFDGLGFKDYRDSLKGTYLKRLYCVQYEESDFAFISRLMEDEGIFYFFTHEADKHILVMADDLDAHPDCPGFTSVRFWRVEDKTRPEDVVHQCRLGHRVSTGKYAVDDYNFETPSTDLMTEVKGETGDMRIYEYATGHAKKNLGDQIAKRRLEALEWPNRLLEGLGYCVGFTVGHKFTLKEHPRKDFNITYVLYELRITANLNDYQNQFLAFPASVQFRPPMTTPRPRITGTQTAIVTGKKGEQLWTDKYGRIKVQFHWDQEGQYDENSSCWIRVNQGWAGKNWGSLWIPRIGQEVIISYINSNPDFPLVTGAVYNAQQTVPYKLPDEQTKSTVKSQSFKGKSGKDSEKEGKAKAAGGKGSDSPVAAKDSTSPASSAGSGSLQVAGVSVGAPTAPAGPLLKLDAPKTPALDMPSLSLGLRLKNLWAKLKGGAGAGAGAGAGLPPMPQPKPSCPPESKLRKLICDPAHLNEGMSFSAGASGGGASTGAAANNVGQGALSVVDAALLRAHIQTCEWCQLRCLALGSPFCKTQDCRETTPSAKALASEQTLPETETETGPEEEGNEPVEVWWPFFPDQILIPTVFCPPADKLRAQAAKRLEQAEGDEILRHVKACPFCQARCRRLGLALPGLRGLPEMRVPDQESPPVANQDCPEDQVLTQLLNVGESVADPAVLRHICQCETCRGRLKELSSAAGYLALLGEDTAYLIPPDTVGAGEHNCLLEVSRPDWRLMRDAENFITHLPEPRIHVEALTQDRYREEQKKRYQVENKYRQEIRADIAPPMVVEGRLYQEIMGELRDMLKTELDAWVEQKAWNEKINDDSPWSLANYTWRGGAYRPRQPDKKGGKSAEAAGVPAPADSASDGQSLTEYQRLLKEDVYYDLNHRPCEEEEKTGEAGVTTEWRMPCLPDLRESLRQHFIQTLREALTRAERERTEILKQEIEAEEREAGQQQDQDHGIFHSDEYFAKSKQLQVISSGFGFLQEELEHYLAWDYLDQLLKQKLENAINHHPKLQEFGPRLWRLPRPPANRHYLILSEEFSYLMLWEAETREYLLLMTEGSDNRVIVIQDETELAKLEGTVNYRIFRDQVNDRLVLWDADNTQTVDLEQKNYLLIRDPNTRGLVLANHEDSRLIVWDDFQPPIQWTQREQLGFYNPGPPGVADNNGLAPEDRELAEVNAVQSRWQQPDAGREQQTEHHTPYLSLRDYQTGKVLLLPLPPQKLKLVLPASAKLGGIPKTAPGNSPPPPCDSEEVSRAQISDAVMENLVGGKLNGYQRASALAHLAAGCPQCQARCEAKLQSQAYKLLLAPGAEYLPLQAGESLGEYPSLTACQLNINQAATWIIQPSPEIDENGEPLSGKPRRFASLALLSGLNLNHVLLRREHYAFILVDQQEDPLSKGDVLRVGRDDTQVCSEETQSYMILRHDAENEIILLNTQGYYFLPLAFERQVLRAGEQQTSNSGEEQAAENSGGQENNESGEAARQIFRDDRYEVLADDEFSLLLDDPGDDLEPDGEAFNLREITADTVFIWPEGELVYLVMPRELLESEDSEEEPLPPEDEEAPPPPPDSPEQKEEEDKDKEEETQPGSTEQGQQPGMPGMPPAMPMFSVPLKFPSLPKLKNLFKLGKKPPAKDLPGMAAAAPIASPKVVSATISFKPLKDIKSTAGKTAKVKAKDRKEAKPEKVGKMPTVKPDPGFNEVRFDDKKDEEEIFLHAQKDYNLKVWNDETRVIKMNRSATIEEEDDKLVVAKGSRFTTIKKARETTIEEEDDILNIDGGSRLITIKSKDYKLKVEKGNRELSIDKGKEDHYVKGNRSLKVDGNQDTKVKGNYVLKVTGNLTIDVTGNIKIKSGKNIQIDSSMNTKMKAGMNMKLKAGMNMHLKAGVNIKHQAGVTLNDSGGVSIKHRAGVSMKNKGGVMMENKGGVMLKNKGGVMMENKAGVMLTNEGSVLHKGKGGAILMLKGGIVMIN